MYDSSLVQFMLTAFFKVQQEDFDKVLEHNWHHFGLNMKVTCKFFLFPLYNKNNYIVDERLAMMLQTTDEHFVDRRRRRHTVKASHSYLRGQFATESFISFS